MHLKLSPYDMPTTTSRLLPLTYFDFEDALKHPKPEENNV